MGKLKEEQNEVRAKFNKAKQCNQQVLDPCFSQRPALVITEVIQRAEG
jgi:hypothetical protein